MLEAARLATENIDNNGGPFGAVIVRNGEIVGRGVNRVTANNDPTAHAEVMAIRDAASRLKTFNLSDCEIYTSCEPCPMCLGAIYWSHLKKIYYGCNQKDAAQIDFDDKFIYDQFAKSIEKREIEEEEYLRDECIPVFEKWRNALNKTPY